MVNGNAKNGAVGELIFHNRYSYANNNPVNLVDRSGMIPERDKITGTDFEYTYSCDCGWIDWKHANPDITAKGVLDYVERALLYLEANPGATAVAIDGADIQHKISIPVLGQRPTFDRVIVIRSAMNRSNWQQVAMAIFRTIEYAHENSLASHSSATQPTWTQFAEEDLTSDLIAFYRALDSKNWQQTHAYQVLSEVCRFPRNEQVSQAWSLQVYDEYGSFQQVGTWESPRLHSTPAIRNYCGATPRHWPSELKTIQPNYDAWSAYTRFLIELAGVGDDLHFIRPRSDVASAWLETC